jgi:hypothetical protein
MKKNLKPLILLFSVLLSSATLAKVYVISDIDDTIKKANSAGKPIPLVYHFLRKKIYPEMRDLFNELQGVYEKLGEEVEFIYVSAAPDFTFAQEKWIEKHNFPLGDTYLKQLDSPKTYEYKTQTITKVLKDAEVTDTIYFFGDNSSKDPIVYTEVSKKLGLVNSFIFIRDVSTEATYWNEDLPIVHVEGASYFFSERELIGMEGLFFISEELTQKIQSSYNNKDLVPCYTQKTLKRRLRKSYGCGLKRYCRSVAKENSERYWNEYFGRY